MNNSRAPLVLASVPRVLAAASELYYDHIEQGRYEHVETLRTIVLAAFESISTLDARDCDVKTAIARLAPWVAVVDSLDASVAA